MRNSLKLLNTCINAIDSGVCIINQQGIIQMINSTLAGWCESESENLEGKLYTEMLPEDQESAIWIKALIKGEQDKLTACKVWWKTPQNYKYIKGYAIDESYEDGKSRIVFLNDISDEVKQKNQLQYQALVLNNVQDSVIVIDQEGIITYWNKAATALFGHTEKEMLGYHIDTFNPGFDPQAFIANAKGNKEYYRRTDWKHIRQDGKEVWADVKVSLLYDDSGNEFKGFIGVSKDITERKEAEQKIHYLNAFNELLLEISKNFINLSAQELDKQIIKALKSITLFTEFDRSSLYIFNEDQSLANLKYEYCAPGIPAAAVETHTYPAEPFSWLMNKILSRKVIEIYDPKQLPPEANNEQYALETMGVKSVVSVPVTYQNHVIGYIGFSSITAHKNWDQDTIALLELLAAIFANTLHRAQTDLNLEESRNQYKLLADNISDVIIKHDTEFRVTFATPSCKEMLGYLPEELLDRSFAELVYPEDLPLIAKHVRQALAGRYIRFVTRLKKKNEAYLWVETGAKAFKDVGKTELIATIRDIDVQKRIEIEKDDLFRETHALNEELRASEEELRQTLDKTVELNDQIARSERKFKGLTEKSFDAIVVYNERGEIKYASPSAARIVGYEVEELEHMTGAELTHEEDLPRVEEVFQKILQTSGERVHFEQRAVRKGGHAIWVEAVFTNLLGDEAIRGIVSNFRDVTDKKLSAMELEESRTSLNVAQQVAKVGSWEIKLSGMKSYLSDEFYNILGLDREKHEVSPLDFLQFVHPEDREIVHTAAEQVRQEHKVSDLEYRIIDSRGQLKYIHAHSRVMKDEQGKIVKLLGTIQDVTREVELEKLLEETSRLAKVGGWELNLITNELIWTKETYAMHEVPFGELVNVEEAVQFYHPEDLPILEEALSKIMTQGEKYDLELRIITTTGKVKWIRTTGGIIDKAGGKVSRVRGSIQDITERKLRDEEVKNYSKRLKLATESAQIGVWDLDIQNNALYWDKQTCLIFGVKDDKYEGNLEGLRKLIYAEDLEKVPDLEALRAWKSEDLDIQFRIIRADTREVRYIKSSAKALFDKQQRAVRMIGVHWDITSLRENEERLKKNNEELRKTNAELDHFVYSTSHNLRAPLTSVMGIVDILRESSLEEERTQFIDLIQKSIYKLDETIQEINDYSKNSRVEVQKELVDLKQMIENIVESLSFMDNARKMKIDINIADSLTFYSDLGRLKIIFNNLLSNAVKYANPVQENSFVSIVVKKKDNDILIQVKDNGIGIKQEYLDKVFEMFFRATNKSSGSGLGLYIVKEAVEKLGGTISVKSAPGEGTDFTIQVPNLG